MTKWWQYMSTRHPWRVLGVSLLIVLGLAWYATGLFGNLSEEEMDVAADTPSVVAKRKLEDKFGSSPASQLILFERKDAGLGEAGSALYQAEVAKILQPLRAKMQTVQTFADQPSAAFISKDKTATYAIIATDKPIEETYRLLTEFARDADQSKLRVSVGGEAASIKQTTEAANEFLLHAEMISIPILLVLLFVFFRSGVAALLPLVMSAVTIVGAFAIARFITNFFSIDTYAVNVITILGLGLSIDYALLSVNRFREELHGRTVQHAVRTIVATTGRTIFFSGITVIACLLSLMVFPVEMLRSIAVGGASAVAVAVAFTVLVLPAMLMVIGKRIDMFHLPMKRHTGESAFWKRVASLTTTHPVVALGIGLVIVAGATLSLGKFHVGQMDAVWLARGSSAQHVAQVMQHDFAAHAPSITALVVLPDGMSDDARRAVSCDMTQKLQKISGVSMVVSATPLSQQVTCDSLRMMAITGRESPQLATLTSNYMRATALRFDVSLQDKVGSKQAEEALQAIRALVPSRGDYYVGGSQAVFIDTNQLYYSAIPWAVAIIVASMMVLLAVSLRSLVLPLQAMVINSIALAISLAVIVGVFQLGWLRESTGWLQTEGMILTAPILVVAIAFGLAMDYSVFLYSRMREEYDASGDPQKAIVEGVVKTGPIITAAALALFVVVVAFALSSVMFMQIIGVGLSVAVLVDAFFVRLILVPAIMSIMGRTSWYGPRWLNRFSIKHE